MGTGEAVVKAEVTHKGKKKDAITQCALVKLNSNTFTFPEHVFTITKNLVSEVYNFERGSVLSPSMK